MNEVNSEVQESNLAQLKNQVFEPNNQILNRPIAEEYEHRNLAGRVRKGAFDFGDNPFDDVESTIKLSFVLEEMRKDPKKLDQMLGNRRRSDVGVFKYKLRHGPLSPTMLKNDGNVKLFDTLTRDVKVAKTAKKELHRHQSLASGRNASHLGQEQSTAGNESHLSRGTKAPKTIRNDMYQRLWEKPFFVMLMKDG